ncbi:zinc-binding dehydrogenase [Sphingobium sp. V4]|uniref:zinc-dependent alcohol dehydrogenase n=1 Tax=Sphingobium sp. V4 TaxID=3038927 RepID=UPI00255816A7|nr:zinc-binding dehydrogenase [Sphingobium sp. V4]WIW89444.1 zinc-binding dehydrogenase [Sphingobium sp. V4]
MRADRRVCFARRLSINNYNGEDVMLQLQIHGRNDLRLDNVQEPLAGPNDIIVQTKACGICGTDLIYRRNGRLRSEGQPLPIGHEATGIVTTVGEHVKDIQPGLGVIINPMAKSADPANKLGILGNGAPEGAFAHRFLVRDVKLNEDVFEIPPGVTYEQAAFTDPLGVALHAIYQGKCQPSEKVVIYGAGPIGLAAILWLKRMGINDIVTIARSSARLGRALALGARSVIDASREDVAERLAQFHGVDLYKNSPVVGTDVFIDLAGAAGIVPAILDMAKFRARVVLPGVHEEPETVSLFTVMRKEITIVGAIGYPTEIPEVVAALPDLADAITDITSHLFAFDNVLDAFAMAGAPECSKIIVTFDS